MTIDIYYNSISPPARAALAVAKHLGLEVNVKTLNLFEGETRTPEFLKVKTNNH